MTRSTKAKSYASMASYTTGSVWTADSLTYAKLEAGCVDYVTRIDFAQKRAAATRTLRSNAPSALRCDLLDRRSAWR